MPRPRRIRLNIGPPSTRASFTTQAADVRRPLILGVAQRALDHLLEHPRTALRLVAAESPAHRRPRLPRIKSASGRTLRALIRACRELLCMPWLSALSCLLAGRIAVTTSCLSATLPPAPPDRRPSLLPWPCRRGRGSCASERNSPSRWPTMSSVTNTFKCVLPLWTMNVWPTNSGMIVQARAQVVIGSLMPRVVQPLDLAE